MKTKLRLVKNRKLLIAILILPLLYLSKIWIEQQAFRANENSGKTTILDYAKAQQAYKSEYGHFSDNLKTLVVHVPAPFELFVDSSQLKPEYAEIIGRHNLQFIKPSSFRALLAVKNKFKPVISFWVVDDQSEPRLLGERLELRD